ncbi:MAG TPA: YdcF family protein [Rhodanobacteraceae bacterium]|nr:YdcF family protein [Rhodanobacteraceae bacterium]
MLTSRLIDTLLSPLSFGLLLALILWLARARAPRWLWRAGFVLEAACVVLATPVCANALVAWQEQRNAVRAPCATPEPSTIVLLAGGARRVPRDAGDIGALNDASVQRTLAAAELMQVPGSLLVISGGSRPGDRIAESTLMAALASRLGVPAAAIRVETRARTTWENAQDVRALVPAVPHRIELVTSALHMPRALIAFRAAGFDACAHPVDFRATPIREFEDFVPRGGGVARTEAVLHELVGELAYRWRAARG